MLGFAILGIGALFIWASLTGRATAVLDALNINLPGQGTGSGGSSGGSGGGGGGGGSSSSNTDIGTHQAMDANGNIYTVNSTYGNATAQQQDDMNRYANNIGNFPSSTA